MQRVLILGGGTGGALLANLLARHLDPVDADITVVTALTHHYYQPGWLYIPFGREDPRKLSRPVRDLVDPAVRMVHGEVTKVDLSEEQVVLEDGTRLDFDLLVIATGSHLDEGAVPGLDKGGHHFYTQDGALRLFGALNEFRGGRIVVGVSSLPYKCPVAPLEFAFLLDEFLEDAGLRKDSEICFLTPGPALVPIESVARLSERLLEERNIRVRTGFQAVGVEAARNVLHGASGLVEPYDLLVLIPPHRGASFLRGSPLADGDGWVFTDPGTLHARGHTRIWAMGDATDLGVGKAGSVAHFQAPCVAEQILAFVGRRDPDPRKAVYGGHAACFLEVGHHRATFVDFDYQNPPVVREPTAAVHYLKMAFNKAYFHLVPTGVV